MVPAAEGPARWFGSFYFRIGSSFVVFVVAVTVAQSAMFNYAMTRQAFPGRSPNAVAAMVAADIGSTLAQDPGLDLQQYLTEAYGDRRQPVYVMLKDGRIAGTRPTALPVDSRRVVEAVLAGRGLNRLEKEDSPGSPPTVMAPIQISNELRGMVVLPAAPAPSLLEREVRRLLFLPGTVLLILGTIVAAAFVFEPTRRRLKALEDAARRLGAGDLAARAPEKGGDEIAHVAAAFNRMADDLASRDEALRTSDRLRRQMLADISHELKTPLTSMRGCVETLRMRELKLDEATRDRYFETFERETLRLDRLVKDLLDLTRLEHGAGELDRRYFAVDRVFEHVIRRHEHEAAERRISLRTAVDEPASQVFGDPDRIEQVIENLAANALRHTHEGGTIEFSARAGHAMAVLLVTDSGDGIPPEHLQHVFERFYKVDTARTNGPAGSGLGLSIAKAIVERHGGTIRVESAPGRTAFTIALPEPEGPAPQAPSANL
jgi:two-component system, OmpR family, sensor kinase